MKTLDIKGYQVILDDEDYERFHSQKMTVLSNPARRGFFYFAYRLPLKKSKCRKLVLLHRMILDCPDNLIVDHINGDTLDNRRENLRICTKEENNRNSSIRHTNKSGYKGVSWHKATERWRAQIRVRNKVIHLGAFKDPIMAYSIYCEAAKKYHGEFAKFE